MHLYGSLLQRYVAEVLQLFTALCSSGIAVFLQRYVAQVLRFLTALCSPGIAALLQPYVALVRDLHLQLQRKNFTDIDVSRRETEHFSTIF